MTADSGWCAVDDCPATVCGGPHVDHVCADGSRVSQRFDNPAPCPFCGATNDQHREMPPVAPTQRVVIELAVHVLEDADPRVAAAALFDLISAVPCPWPEGMDPPGIVSYDSWEVRDG